MDLPNFDTRCCFGSSCRINKDPSADLILFRNPKYRLTLIFLETVEPFGSIVSQMHTMQVIRALSAVVVLGGVVFAQSNGAITGTVKDSKGGVIVNATVAAANPGQGVPGLHYGLPGLLVRCSTV